MSADSSNEAIVMGKRIPICMLTLLVLAAFAGGSPHAVFAESADSMCVRISGTVEGEHISLSRRYSLGGMLPVTVCSLEPTARYRLTLDGEGLERRIGGFSIGVSGHTAVHGIRFSAVSRNAVLPGWGSAYAGRAAAALVDDIAITAALAILYQEQMEYRHLRNRLEADESHLGETMPYEERERFQAAAHAASRELNVQNEYRRRLAVLAGALYAWQVLEPFIADNPPASAAGAGAGEITLRGSRESRAKAFFYSLVRPGRGQMYQGKTARGFVYSIAALAGGLAALNYQNEYDVAVNDYEVCVERFDATDVVPEKERLLSEASLLWSNVERQRDRRNASLVVLAAMWGWNVIDTFFDGGASASGAQRLSLGLDARGASVALRF
jgi:hypothetical protein